MSESHLSKYSMLVSSHCSKYNNKYLRVSENPNTTLFSVYGECLDYIFRFFVAKILVNQIQRDCCIKSRTNKTDIIDSIYTRSKKSAYVVSINFSLITNTYVSEIFLNFAVFYKKYRGTLYSLTIFCYYLLWKTNNFTIPLQTTKK